MNTSHERRDGACPADPSDAELRPTDGPDRGPQMPAAADDFFAWLRSPLRNAGGPADLARFLFVLFIALAFWSVFVGRGEQTASDLNQAIPPASGDLGGDLNLLDPPSDGLPAPDLSARQKRLASKAAYRARRSTDETFREGERQRVRAWRRDKPDKARAQKTKARAANYNRPFVAIDSEGQDYPGGDIWL